MSAELDLSLPEREMPRKKIQGPRSGLLWLILAAGIANIVILLMGFRVHGSAVGSSGGLDRDARKQLALKLEKQGLHAVAAEAWMDYLTAAGLEKKEAARIWYRIGVIYQDGEDYERALDAFYHSESFAAVDGLDLDIARRTQECLETMGKFTALRHALGERVGLGENAGTDSSQVVAEIGPMKITQAELDKRIEEFLQVQLDRMGPVLGDEERKQRKEEMLKQFSSSSQRLQMLNQLIFEELLYRDARDSELAAKPEVRKMLRHQERSLLASKVIERDVMEKIRITPAEVEAYYQAHKSEYVEADDEGGEKQKTLDEVRGEVYGALRAQREQELQQKVFQKLMSSYDVVIHHSAFGAEGGGNE